MGKVRDAGLQQSHGGVVLVRRQALLARELELGRAKDLKQKKCRKCKRGALDLLISVSETWHCETEHKRLNKQTVRT